MAAARATLSLSAYGATVDGAVEWLGVVRTKYHKGGQTANETTVLAICYLDVTTAASLRCPRSDPSPLLYRYRHSPVNPAIAHVISLLR